MNSMSQFKAVRKLLLQFSFFMVCFLGIALQWGRQEKGSTDI